MKPLRFAVLGTGFWSHFQIPAWYEVGGVELVAVYNRTQSREEEVARKFNVPRIYSDAEELFRSEQLDFVDIITAMETHGALVELAARYRVPVICQKPMAQDPAICERMVERCRRANVPFLIHENWRWQAPIRAFYEQLRQGQIGRPFRARIDILSDQPAFDNQPFLKTLDKFIVMELGSHILDVARLCFGEARSIYCLTRRVHHDIKGEDAATIVMEMGRETVVTCNLAMAESPLERPAQTYLFVEGERGSLELFPDYWIHETTQAGTVKRRAPPPGYPWVIPAYEPSHSSIVACNANLLAGLQGTGKTETTGEDNIKTMQLVFAAYQSAESGEVLHFDRAEGANA